jgi:hypothetical protein
MSNQDHRESPEPPATNMTQSNNNNADAAASVQHQILLQHWTQQLQQQQQPQSNNAFSSQFHPTQRMTSAPVPIASTIAPLTPQTYSIQQQQSSSEAAKKSSSGVSMPDIQSQWAQFMAAQQQQQNTQQQQGSQNTPQQIQQQQLLQQLFSNVLAAQQLQASTNPSYFQQPPAPAPSFHPNLNALLPAPTPGQSSLDPPLPSSSILLPTGISEDVGSHTFNEGWKTMWDDEDPQLPAAAQDEDWTPTPLAELQARQQATNMYVDPAAAPIAPQASQLHQSHAAAILRPAPAASVLPPPSSLPPPLAAPPSLRLAPRPKQPAASSLPSTVLPPSVMTSILPPEQSRKGLTYKKRNVVTGKAARIESPQDYLERMVRLRGFQVAPGGGSNQIRISAEWSGYDTVPSPLQLASFGTELVKAIHESDVAKLSRLLAAGLSPNPCNQFRDSIVDLVCKRANAAIFQCLINHGCDVRVCDGFGRTPLHHCCWASEFNADIATLILHSDSQQLFMEDKRGQMPLEYVRPDQAPLWIEYLEDHANALFPTGGSLAPISSLKQMRPTGHLPDPPHALPVSLATAVSSGTLTPEEVEQMDPALRARFG